MTLSFPQGRIQSKETQGKALEGRLTFSGQGDEPSTGVLQRGQKGRSKLVFGQAGDLGLTKGMVLLIILLIPHG